MILIVGLGNPGKKYEKTRHNIGFMVVEELARKWTTSGVIWEENQKFNSQILKIVHNDHARACQLMSIKEELILVKPQTYMNNSGMAVVSLVSFYKVGGSDLWVIHDDLDIPVGRIKISEGKGTAGHHGIISIVEALSSTDFVRFRLGIAHSKVDNPQETLIDNPEKFVLEPFLPTERDEARKMIKQAILAIKVALKDGIEKAMNQFNR